MADTVKILHVVGGTVRGGTSTWLVDLLRHIDRERFCFDFLIPSTKPGCHDNEICALGGKIFRCPLWPKPWEFWLRFRRILRENGPYSVVHSHPLGITGYVMRLAAHEGVPMRIAHAHSAPDGRGDGLSRFCYQMLMKRWIDKYATVGLGVSKEANRAIFGASWKGDPRCRVFHCSIDLPSFGQLPDSTKTRRALGIPQDALVVGHVGRFVSAKNHAFWVEVAREVVQRHPDPWFMLVGDGKLRPMIEQKVRALGLRDRFIFTGLRRDVPALMAAMDTFLFPSYWEGLGLALVEAQTAGLRCVTSDSVPVEASVIPAHVTRLSLTAGAPTWAEAVLNAATLPCPDRAMVWNIVAASPFVIHRCIRDLCDIYSNVSGKHIH